ncbi:hypothetical protein [Roseovarius sp. EL26]|uniref:hypothetical protein n=1 Tax=Roseovarius sp. EL26 TaxID=2126672 RepID=UPI000EA0F555|nr:hypothetical protein [Roseovarius sp. EL26]
MIRTLISILCLMFAWPTFAEEKEGGIIGTGVIGQITALDEFEVSGMRFDFASDIELKGLSKLEDLRMGMTLALSTGRDGASWQIKTLQHMPILTGPITAPGEVMGVPITGALPNSGTVQIDGFWSKDGIVASRIVEVQQDNVQISGIYDELGLVGQVPVRGAGLTGLAAGKTVSISGQFENGVIVMDTAMEGPFMGSSPDLVLLEGYFQPMAASNSLSLQGVAIASAEGERDVGLDQLVRRCSLSGRIDFLLSDLTQSDAELVKSFCISASN